MSRRCDSITQPSSFPVEVLDQVLSLLSSRKDRSSVSLVCRDRYTAERLGRTCSLFIGNCYSASPEIVASRFPNMRSLTLKGKPKYSVINLVSRNCSADIHPWLVVFAQAFNLFWRSRDWRVCHWFPNFNLYLCWAVMVSALMVSKLLHLMPKQKLRLIFLVNTCIVSE